MAAVKIIQEIVFGAGFAGMSMYVLAKRSADMDEKLWLLVASFQVLAAVYFWGAGIETKKYWQGV